MAADPRLVASLLGPAMIAVATAEYLNRDVWQAGGPSHAYLTGTLLALGGLVVVRFHNLWTTDWPVFVTLTGWFMLVGGLFRMLAPTLAWRAAPVGDPVVDGGILVLGIFLTVMAYRPR